MLSKETASQRKRLIRFGFPQSGKRFSFLIKIGYELAGHFIPDATMVTPKLSWAHSTSRRLSH